MFYVPVRRLGAGEPTKNIIGSLPPAPGAHYSEKIHYYICKFENRRYGSHSNTGFFVSEALDNVLFSSTDGERRNNSSVSPSRTWIMSVSALWH